MNGFSDISWQEMSNTTITRVIGEFIKQNRLNKNLTQSKIAIDAGISRSTLSLLEKGETVSIATLLQVLRVLDLLYVLNNFEQHQEISPLEVAKMEMKKRKRASYKTNDRNNELSEDAPEPW